MTESSAHPYKRIRCNTCDGDMILKVSSANKLFFGCSNYPECTNTLDKNFGLRKLNQINQITIDDIYDLEDIY